MKRLSKKNKTLSRILTLVIFIVIILMVRLYEDIGEDIAPDDRFLVVKVIDGDTVELKGGDRLRLLAIDTPEKDEPFYNEAKSFLAKMALNRNVRITYNRTRRDRYGRLLGYVYIDSIFVNEAIIRKGLGCLYLFQDNERNLSET